MVDWWVCTLSNFTHPVDADRAVVVDDLNGLWICRSNAMNTLPYKDGDLENDSHSRLYSTPVENVYTVESAWCGHSVEFLALNEPAYLQIL